MAEADYGLSLDEAYPEYNATEDFLLWLSGYEARVHSSYGYQLGDCRSVQEKVVDTIAGKLAVGFALNTYNDLPEEVKQDYISLVARLNEEFLDPRAKKKFNKSLKFNKRKKGEPLKDFMQSIIQDLKRYSDIPVTILTRQGTTIPNPDRESNGVRRFIEGIRDFEGKKDADFKRHLEYHIQNADEMTWANVMDVATRYETIEDDSSSDSDVGTSKRPELLMVENKDDLATLVEQVNENRDRIIQLEESQQQLLDGQEAINETLQEITSQLDYILATIPSQD